MACTKGCRPATLARMKTFFEIECDKEIAKAKDAAIVGDVEPIRIARLQAHAKAFELAKEIFRKAARAEDLQADAA